MEIPAPKKMIVTMTVIKNSMVIYAQHMIRILKAQMIHQTPKEIQVIKIRKRTPIIQRIRKRQY